MIKTFIIIVFCIMLQNHNVDNNSFNNPKFFNQYQSATISATFGNTNNIKRLGGKEYAWMIKFNQDGTIVEHNWKEAGGNHYKVQGSDTYKYGRYVITESTSRRKDIKIIWSNGKEEKCYIIYTSHNAELHYNMHCYDEF